MNAAVVGAGIMGASAARFLSKRGHQVTVFEQFGPGHEMGSSHGRSRIVRKAYPDPFYTEIMQEGYPMWRELEKEAGRKIVHECGLVYFGPENAPNVASMVQGLRDLDVRFDVLGPDQSARVFPALRLEKGEVAVFTPEAGWADAEAAVAESLAIAQRHGAIVRKARVSSVEEVERTFDAVVLCPGGWIGKFLDVPVDVQARTFAYLEARQEGPVWIEEGPGLHYGFPSEPGAGTIKIGGHVADQPFDADRPDRPVLEGNVEAIRSLAERRFGIRKPKVTEAKTCLYTWRENEDFLIGRASEKTVFASPCSGHGFKFGPWVGKYLADLAEHKAEPDRFPRFNFRPAIRG
jgi:glycine/D-amino acid oxidase-like deaminating enzyme